jgi:hypothetical protein
MMFECSRRAIITATGALLALVAIGAPAAAQFSTLSRTGPPVEVFPPLSGFGDHQARIAYDAVNARFLAIHVSIIGVDETLWGAFLDTQGNRVGSPFRIDSNTSSTEKIDKPDVAYSPHMSDGSGGFGAFLVRWRFTTGRPAPPEGRSRIVSFPGVLVGGEMRDIDIAGYLSYSPVSKTFLVVGLGTGGLMALPLGLDGQPAGPAKTVARDCSPSRNATWNSTLNEFGLFCRGVSLLGLESRFFRLSPAGDVLRSTVIPLTTSVSNAGAAFNPQTGNYVAVWTQSAPDPGSYAVEISGEGDILGRGQISTSMWFGLEISFSPVSYTFLVLAQDIRIYSVSGFPALELNGHGAPNSTVTLIDSVPRFLPHTAARLDTAGWLIVAESISGPVTAHPVATSASEGGSIRTLPSECLDPDLTRTLAGDQCVDGIWLPRVVAPLIAAPPPQGTSDGSCTIADPFIALGGGICRNGNWHPPGMPIPPSTPAPPAPPSPPPAPTPPTGGCTIPDPFVSLGGGTCVNGNWLPPGFPGATPPPSTPPPSPPPPTGCTGSDPFLGLPGLAGVCINGDWIPTELLQNVAATVQQSGSTWQLRLDDGRIFVPLSALAPAFQTHGLRVTISGKVRIDLPSTPPTLEVLSIS